MNLLVNPSQIQEVCDTVGVSRKGYRAISRIFFQVLRYYKIKAFGLPRPHKVGKFRLFLNAKIPENFGDYDHIEGIMPYDKGGRKCSFEYNAFNNIWMNVRKIQIAMIKYYGIKDHECEGLLKFVMKLDEAQIQKS